MFKGMFYVQLNVQFSIECSIVKGMFYVQGNVQWDVQCSTECSVFRECSMREIAIEKTKS
jgi:hypothetical protein